MVLLVLRVRDGAKPWYACNVPETVTVDDVFGELSAGLLDNSRPLPEEYRTTSVEAVIGRSPKSQLFHQSRRSRELSGELY